MNFRKFRLVPFMILFFVAACAAVPTPVKLNLITPTPKPSKIAPEVIDEIDSFLANLSRDRLFSGSALIAQDGQVLYTGAYGMADRKNQIANTVQTRFYIGSLTKGFTAVSILMLAAQGRLDVQDKICQYLDDCPQEWDKITIHHLLTHTSGINPNAKSDDFKLVSWPGFGFTYSDNNYTQLGRIITKISGQPYPTFIKQNILDPLRMVNSGFGAGVKDLATGYTDKYMNTPVEDNDYSDIEAAAGMYSTVEDLQLWDQALYSEMLLPREYLDKMFSSQIKINDEFSYGYGWGLTTNPSGRPLILHDGQIEGYNSLLARYPQDHVVVIMLTNVGTSVEPRYRIIDLKIFGGQ